MLLLMLPGQFCEQVRRHAFNVHPDIRDASSSKFITNIEALRNSLSVPLWSSVTALTVGWFAGRTCKFLNKWCTYLLTPYSRVLLEKLTGFAANQEIPRILWNPKVQTVLTSA
jgi:hypothetical protein